MGRGRVQVREVSSHKAVGRQVEATWSGRICTWPVLTTDTRRIGSVMFISVPSNSVSQRRSPLRRIVRVGALQVAGASSGFAGAVAMLGSWPRWPVSLSDPAVPPGVVRAHAEGFRYRPQRREHDVLHCDGRRGDPAFVAEVPEGGAQLERVARRAPGRGPAVGGQAGDGLVEFPGVQRWPQLHDSLDLGGSGVSLGMAHPGRHDDRLARPGHEFLAVEGEAGLAGGNDEALLLAGMNVLGDYPAGHAAPAEADQLPVAVPGNRGELDPLAGGRVEEGPEAGHRKLEPDELCRLLPIRSSAIEDFSPSAGMMAHAAR